MKKALFVTVFALVLAFGLAACGGSSASSVSSAASSEVSSAASSESTSSPQAVTAKRYELSGADLGEYGRVVVLNKDTDMPVEKNLYKLPAGEYKVTTSNDKLSAFHIVKDEVEIEEGNDDYPETLRFVAEHLLTAGSNDFNGRAVKEVTIEIASDESILLPTDKDTIIAEEVLS